MREVEVLAWNLVPRGTSAHEPTFPAGVEDEFDGAEPGENESDVTDHEHEDKPDGRTDKAATPAERIHNMEELSRNLERMRPQLLLPQRDSDVNRHVQESRANALASMSSIDMKTGSNLEEQFKTEYIPRVFHITFPFCVGGPDFKHKTRYRRAAGEGRALIPHTELYLKRQRPGHYRHAGLDGRPLVLCSILLKQGGAPHDWSTHDSS